LQFTRAEKFAFRLIIRLKKKNKLLVRAAKMMITLFRHNKKLDDKKQLKKYSHAKNKFLKTAGNIRLETIQMYTAGDNHRARIKEYKKKMEQCKFMSQAIAEY